MSTQENLPSVTDATFEDCVLKSKDIVLVDFWAAWCGPCRNLKPILPKVAAQFKGRVSVFTYDVEKAGMKYYRRYKLEGVPALVFFKDGKPFKQNLGFLPEAHLRQLFTNALAEAAALNERRLAEARRSFEQAIARGILLHEAAVKTAEVHFQSASNLITSDILSTYNDAIEQHEAGEIDEAALQSAYETFRRAYDERVAGCRAERDQAKADADREYDRLVAEAARVYKQATAQDAPAVA